MCVQSCVNNSVCVCSLIPQAEKARSSKNEVSVLLSELRQAHAQTQAQLREAEARVDSAAATSSVVCTLKMLFDAASVLFFL